MVWQVRQALLNASSPDAASAAAETGFCGAQRGECTERKVPQTTPANSARDIMAPYLSRSVARKSEAADSAGDLGRKFLVSGQHPGDALRADAAHVAHSEREG